MKRFGCHFWNPCNSCSACKRKLGPRTVRNTWHRLTVERVNSCALYRIIQTNERGKICQVNICQARRHDFPGETPPWGLHFKPVVQVLEQSWQMRGRSDLVTPSAPILTSSSPIAPFSEEQVRRAGCSQWVSNPNCKSQLGVESQLGHWNPWQPTSSTHLPSFEKS